MKNCVQLSTSNCQAFEKKVIIATDLLLRQKIGAGADPNFFFCLRPKKLGLGRLQLRNTAHAAVHCRVLLLYGTCMHRCRCRRWRWGPETRGAGTRTPHCPGPTSCPDLKIQN